MEQDMTKDEALKMALEVMRNQGDVSVDEWIATEKAIKEALAQPEQEPMHEPSQTTGETNVELGFYSDATGNGQQWQLVGKVEMGQLVGDRSHKSASNPDAEGEVAIIKGFDEYGPMLDWFKHWVNFPVGTKLYTTPPAAQRTWVGLDDEDYIKALELCDFDKDAAFEFFEAKLKEKNT